MSPTDARLEVLAAALRALAQALPAHTATATAERLRARVGAMQPLAPAADAAMAAELALMLAALDRE